MGFPGGSMAKESTAGDTGSIPGSGSFPGKENGNLLQYSCLENPMDRGTWSVTGLRVPKSRTLLKWLSTHTQYQYQIFRFLQNAGEVTGFFFSGTVLGYTRSMQSDTSSFSLQTFPILQKKSQFPFLPFLENNQKISQKLKQDGLSRNVKKVALTCLTLFISVRHQTQEKLLLTLLHRIFYPKKSLIKQWRRKRDKMKGKTKHLGMKHTPKLTISSDHLILQWSLSKNTECFYSVTMRSPKTNTLHVIMFGI